MPSCEKLENIISISGKVIDQVTEQPVDGATVYLGSLYMGEPPFELVNSGYIATSGNEGRFKINIPDSAFDDNEHEPRIFAGKDGYAGSSVLVPQKGGDSENNILLYHVAKLNLRVCNDTVNNQIDEVEIGLAGSIDNGCYPGYIGRIGGIMLTSPLVREKCKGSNFDTIFVYYPL
jgi:hypothetical protein